MLFAFFPYSREVSMEIELKKCNLRLSSSPWYNLSPPPFFFKFLFFSLSHWTIDPLRNLKQRLWKFCEETNCVMGNVKVANWFSFYIILRCWLADFPTTQLITSTDRFRSRNFWFETLKTILNRFWSYCQSIFFFNLCDFVLLAILRTSTPWAVLFFIQNISPFLILSTAPGNPP